MTMPAGRPTKAPDMKDSSKAVAIIIKLTVEEVTTTMRMHEEEAVSVVVAEEVLAVAEETTPGPVAEVVAVVITTSTGHWMTTERLTTGQMITEAATAVDLPQEEATPWTIDMQVVFSNIEAANLQKLLPEPVDSIVFFSNSPTLRFDLHEGLAHGAFSSIFCVVYDLTIAHRDLLPPIDVTLDVCIFKELIFVFNSICMSGHDPGLVRTNLLLRITAAVSSFVNCLDRPTLEEKSSIAVEGLEWVI